VGTVKSRVNRARKRLAELMFVEGFDDLGLDGLTAAALQGHGGARAGALA
jgi:RNA polymerase sigma-70 factor (ECF subfamily)